MIYINIGIIVSAVLVIVLTLLQNRGNEGGAFSTGDVGGFYQKRRGVERGMFILTVLSTVVFASFALLRITSWGRADTAVSNPPAVPQVEIQTEDPNIQIQAVPVPAPSPAPDSGQ